MGRARKPLSDDAVRRAHADASLPTIADKCGALGCSRYLYTTRVRELDLPPIGCTPMAEFDAGLFADAWGAGVATRSIAAAFGISPAAAAARAAEMGLAARGPAFKARLYWQAFAEARAASARKAARKAAKTGTVPAMRFDEAELARVTADPSYKNCTERARALGCSRTTYRKAIAARGLVVQRAKAERPVAPAAFGPVCPEAARQLFRAVLLEMWRVALHLSFDKCGDYERAAARRWFGSADFDLVCQFAGVDADTMLSRFRAARARLAEGPRTPDKRRSALERIAA